MVEDDEAPSAPLSGGTDDGLQKSRPDYLSSLLRGKAPSLRLESTDDDDNNDSKANKTSDNPTADVAKSLTRMDLSRRFESMREIRPSDELLQQVEVRVNNYSYHVPIRVDAPSIKTVINQSPCYAATNFIQNVGELITGKRKVRTK
jgi:hypothetical protein